MKRTLIATLLVLLACTAADARRLKVRSFTKLIAPGLLGSIVFDNPGPEEV
jgi:hypothetical protein